MKITKFSRIKNYRIFRDFSWPRDLPSFARYNLFYGWNGSGKSTLSSLFATMQRKEPLTEGEVAVEVDGTTEVRGAQFPTTPIPAVRVFNRDFMRETLIAIRNANAKPILYLGQQSVEDARTLKDKQDGLKSVHEALVATISDVEGKAKAIDKYATDQARSIKNHFSGSQTYVTFDRRRFLEGINRIKDRQAQLQPLSEDEKAALDKKRFMQSKADVHCVRCVDVGLKHLTEQVSGILDQTVVSSVLDELASDPPLARWVQDGLALHSGEHQTTTCRFCGNKFSNETRHKYEAHFNDAYTRFQAVLQSACNDIESRLKQLDIAFPAESSLYDDLQSEYATAARNTTASISVGKLYLSALLAGLEIKKNKPFERMILIDVLTEKGLQIENVALVENQIAECFKAMNVVIEKHNNQTKAIAAERATAYNKLVGDCLLSAIPEYDVLVANEKAATEKRKALQAQYDSLAQQIREIELRLTESRKPVEELNKELHSYLGRNELSFEYEGSGYKLLRSGHVADNLSEGECTAITFLYFLKTLSDKSFDKTNGIVVVDDPVSSLDDNALFSAFAYMKERVKDSGQLFVMTHNFSFFRQVKNWVFHVPGQKKKDINLRPGRFYSLKSSDVNNCRAASIGALDPLLLQYESEYHFLFKVLHDVANSQEEGALSKYYNVPNMARRVLESFFAHYVPDKQGELFQKMESVQYDGAVKTRILRLLNTYSHSSVVAEPGHDPTVLSETRDVMKDLLEMIKVLDENHYNGMYSLISTSTAEEDEGGDA